MTKQCADPETLTRGTPQNSTNASGEEISKTRIPQVVFRHEKKAEACGLRLAVALGGKFLQR
jgi:hypothetical protein